MAIFNSIDDYKKSSADITLIMGMFDGIHKGHLELFNMAKKVKNGGKVLVYTFKNHPLSMIKNSNFKLILTYEEKIDLLNSLGVDDIIISEFNEGIMNITAQEFICEIKNKINPTNIVVGFDYTFGKNKQGTALLLKEFFKNTYIIDEITINNKKISSTLLRQCIIENDFDTYYKLTGRYFSVLGTVVHGNNIGSKHEMPTVNLNVPKEKCMPCDGVYITKISVNGNFYKSISSLGAAPTFGRENSFLETHIFDFNEQIYGDKVTVQFLKKIRDIKKFASSKELYDQINKDIKYTINYFKTIENIK